MIASTSGLLAGPTPGPSSKDCVDIAGCLYNGVSGAVSTATGVLDFWSDPWGNTFKALQASARELAGSVLPTVTKATLPDLTADWFLKAYAVSFALAMLLAVTLLLPQLIRVARGVLSGRELLDSLGIYFPLFLIGSMFGPAFGVILVQFFGSLSDSIVGWGVNTSAGSVTDRFRAMLSENDATGIAGGAPVADLLVLLVLLGLLLVVVMLIVQLVTLYFTGVLLPLGLVWVVDPARRRFGLRIVSLWIGLLAAHPLLYLLLSVAYLMVGDNIDAFGKGSSLQKTVTLIVALLALFIAGLSPVALMRLAPVMLSGGGTAASGVAMPAIGLRNLSEANDRYAAPVPVGGGSAGAGDTSPSGGASGGGGTAGDGSVSERASTASPSADSASPAAPAPSPVSTPSGEPELVGASAKSAPAAAETATPAAGGAGVAASGGAGAGAAAAGGAAEGGLIAAGAGESATGAGAAIGVPTIIAGVALAGVRGAKRVGDGVIEKAAAPVEDGERFGSEKLHD